MDRNKIDFVVTWVDGSDPAWLAEKAKYSSDGGDVRTSRYRDWDQLKYWFRAVEKFAPWVNKIHFITYGHLPKWLDVSSPKLHVVKHEDFIPKEYLPVFNSTAIEVHINKIPGLAEQFVYFCDDMYLMKPCKPTDFFRNGKPADMVRLAPIMPCIPGDRYGHHLYVDYSTYRRYFRRKLILKILPKFVNLRYGKILFRNAVNLLSTNMFISSFHFAVPLLKSSMDTIWADHPDIMKLTAESRFRGYDNVNLEVVRGYQLITGNFVPAKKSGICVNSCDVQETKAAIESGKHMNFCINDESSDSTFESDKAAINESFDKVFPEKSSFEL